MAKGNKQLTQTRVKELFDYHSNGYLVWKINKGKRIKKGNVAGTADSNGYKLIRIDGILECMEPQ